MWAQSAVRQETEQRTLFVALMRSAIVARWIGWILLLGTGLLYLTTLDTGLLPRELEGGDLITHQYAQVQARPSNAPGYPLYTMGGWLWFHGLRSLIRLTGDPLPNPIPILSSYSTLWALLALWLLYRICLRLGRSARWPAGHWALAALITGFFAVTYFFWYYATTTEQYSSAVAHTLAIVYVYLLWADAQSRDAQTQGSADSTTRPSPLTPHHPLPTTRHLPPATCHLLLLSFLCGLSLAHMVTVAMIVPPLVIVVLWRRPDLLRRPRVVIGAVASAALPLLSYVYVYARGAAHPEWWGEGNWSSVDAWFWSFVRTAQGQDELSWGLQPGAPFFANGFPELIWQELSAPLLVLGLIGAAGFAFRHERKDLTVLLYGTLLLYLILIWVDRFGNWFQVVLPAYPLVLLGLVPFWLWVEDRLTRATPLLGIAPSLLLIVAILWRADASLPAADSRNRPEDTALDRPALLLDQDLPPGVALFAEKETALGLDYLINVWGIRPDLRVVSSPAADQILMDGGTVLATWTSVPLLRSELTLNRPLQVAAQTPDWVRLAATPSAPDAPEVLLGLGVGEGITLLGYSLLDAPRGDPVLAQTSAAMDVRLYWTVGEESTPADWSVSVRPLQGGTSVTGVDGQTIQQDSPGPVHGLRPFGEMTAGEPVADAYRLPVDPEAVDGLLVILYRTTEEGFDNLAEVRLSLTEP